MSTEALHFLSEARLAQTQRFIDESNTALARLAVTAAMPLDADRLRGFAEMAAMARALRAQILADLAPVFLAEGPAGPLRDDPAARRLIAATEQVAEGLAEMVARIDRLQEGGRPADCTAS